MSSEGKSGGKVDAVSQGNDLSQEREDALSPGREDAPSQEELLLYIRNSSYFDEAFYLEAYPDVETPVWILRIIIFITVPSRGEIRDRCSRRRCISMKMQMSRKRA